jgi:hypothetical protein
MFIAGLLLAICAFGIVWAIVAPSEPTYRGKRLSMWLDEFRALDFSKRNDPKLPQALAIRTIGTNAIPWLLKEYRGGGVWQWRLNQLLSKQRMIKYRFPDVNDRLTRATLGFRALGEIGEPAIPDLLAIVNAYPGYAPGALAGIGRPAIPALQQCLTNMTMFTNSAGAYALVPGNTITEIFNATSAGPFSKSDIEVFLPTIEAWARQATNQQAKSHATWFIEHIDKLK